MGLTCNYTQQRGNSLCVQPNSS